MDTPPRVLIVDDDAMVRETLRTCLGREGYTLEFATNGLDALTQATATLPDLIILDVMMPQMDGFQVCRHLRADPLLAQVPIILLTGLDDHDSRIEGAQAGADDFISKPYDRTELRARVRTITRLNRYRRLLEERERRQGAEQEVHRLYQELQRYAQSLETTVSERTQELQEARDRMQAILESLGEAVIVTDAQQIIRYVNPTFTALTGYAQQEAEGQMVSWWRNIHHSTETIDQLLEAVYRGQARTAEVMGRRADGALYDALLTVTPLLRSDQTMGIGFVGVSRDITLLQEANRIKDRFVSNVSHELRTPLSVMTMTAGNLDVFYERLDDRQRRDMIRDLRAQTRLLNDLIGDILEISRLDSQRGEPERTRLDMRLVIEGEANKQRPIAESKGLTWQVVGTEPLMVRGNERQLGQIVRNLLDNAIKYTPAGGRITCEYRLLAPTEDPTARSEQWPGCDLLQNGIWAACRVCDTGIGIAAEHLPHIFERFYRVKAQSNIPGTGLGLSIVKGLVEQHGGHVGVTSAPDRGSIFAFYLPIDFRS